MRYHLEVGRVAFGEFADLIDLHSIEVYGKPGEVVLALLEDKAAMLGDSVVVEMHERWAGFLRLMGSSPERIWRILRLLSPRAIQFGLSAPQSEARASPIRSKPVARSWSASA